MYLLGFLSKNLDKFEDRLHHIWAFNDLSFPRYDSLDFPLEKPFSLRNFARVANRDVEAVKFLMLQLPAPLEVLCF